MTNPPNGHGLEPLPGIKAVVFDCDGVMFDSREANRAYYNHILAHLQKPPMSEEQFAYAHQGTVDGTLELLFPDPNEMELARAFRKTFTYLPFVGIMKIEPHLKSLLAYLKPRFRVGISTNRSDTMDHVLASHGLTGWFEAVVTSLDVPRPKPDPAGLLMAVDLLDAAPEESVYIGDSPVDEEAARRAGVPFIAFGAPGLAARWHISSLDRVRDILENGGRG